MPRWVIDRAKGFGEAARARLKLDEVPTKSTGAFDGDGGEVARRPFLTIPVTPCANRGPVGDAHRQRRLNPLKACHQFEFKVDLSMDIASEAARLRAAAEAKPLRLPINRKVDESHRAITPEGLSVWYTIQVSPHSRIQERIFERDGSIEGAMPDAVVLASTTEHVAGVIKVAAKHKIPVVPRGAGTGLSGGAVTIRGGIALQVTRMRRILNIDPVAQTAIVE